MAQIVYFKVYKVGDHKPTCTTLQRISERGRKVLPGETAQKLVTF
jgi:hypothetical protein